MPVDEEQVHDLLYQAYETELGGVQVYEAALACARNDDLRGEWEHYLDQTRHHVEPGRFKALRAFGLDPGHETPGRQVVRHNGEALVQAIGLAQGGGTPEQAQGSPPSASPWPRPRTISIALGRGGSLLLDR